MGISRRAEAQVEESIFSLFQEFPSLCGFTVQAWPSGVALADLGLYPPPADEEAKAIQAGIQDALAELLSERPEARSLLAGRTFARAVH